MGKDYSAAKSIIAISNMKGGCAKTTTAVNLAASLASGCPGKFEPSKVLLIDLDPQGNVASTFGIDKSELNLTVSDLLMDDEGLLLDDIDKAILSSEMIDRSMSTTWRKVNGDSRKPPRYMTAKNLHILPSDLELSGTNIELSNKMGREKRLREIVARVATQYDHIVIDTSPSVGLLTINALAAANHLIIPVQAEWYALEGLSQLIVTVKQIQKQINPRLRLFGVLMTMVDRTKLAQTIQEEVRKMLKDTVFDTFISRAASIASAPQEGAPTVLLHRNARKEYRRGANQYIDFTKEFLARLEKRQRDELGS